MTKKSLSDAFNHAASTYNDYAWVQKHCATLLVDQLPTHLPSPLRVLDIGAGTGNVGAALLTRCSSLDITLNDIALRPILQAQRLLRPHASVHLLEGDIQHCLADRSLSPSYHLITANMSLNWHKEWPNILKRLAKKTHVFALSLPLAPTFKSWRDLFKEKLNILLPNPLGAFTEEKIQDVCVSLQAKDMRLLTRTFSLAFPSPYAFALYLKRLGVHTHENLETQNLLRLRHIKDPFVVHYVVLFVILVFDL